VSPGASAPGAAALPVLKIAPRPLERARTDWPPVIDNALPPPTPAHPDRWIPSFLSHNINGLGISFNKYFSIVYNSDKIQSVKNIINMHKQSIDVILLQETCHSSRYILPNNFTPFGATYPSKFYSTSGDNKSDGIICFAKSQIQILDGSVSLERGRLDYIQLKHNDFPNTVHVYHVYNYSSNITNSNTLLQRLNLHLTLSEYSNSDLVFIVGDLNINTNSSPFAPPPPQGGIARPHHDRLPPGGCAA